MPLDPILEQILDLARWAPSGDNTQPWRFEIVDPSRIVVHGFDTRDHCVYDLTGHPSQMSIGALLETMRIAASADGRSMRVERRISMPDTTPTFDVEFVPDAAALPDQLIHSIRKRSVQRRAISTRVLSSAEKKVLEASIGEQCSVVWLEGFGKRLEMSKLMFANARLRLTMPEAYRVHKGVIAWNAQFSEDRVPDQALGVDPMTARLMRFVMHDWQRVEFFNRFLAGTWAPRIAMDFIPGMACGAHYILKMKSIPQTVDDFVAAGRVVQRFWLTATHLGLVMQPEMTPLIFAGYAASGISFTRKKQLERDACRLQGSLEQAVGLDWRHAFWMGRIGAGSPARARSTRLPLERLIMSP